MIPFPLKRKSAREDGFFECVRVMKEALCLPVDLLSTSALDARFLQAIKGEEKLIYERI